MQKSTFPILYTFFSRAITICLLVIFFQIVLKPQQTFAATYEIKGTIYQDMNGDALYNDEWNPNPDVFYTTPITVTLTDANGNQISQKSRSSNGNYDFQGIATGQYTVSIDINSLPKNAISVSPYANSTSATVSVGPTCWGPPDADCTSTQGPPGPNIYDLDFGFTFPACICACNASANTCSTNNGTITCDTTVTNCLLPTNNGSSCTVNNCSATNICSNGTCVPAFNSISGTNYIDANDNGVFDSGDTLYSGTGQQVEIKGTGFDKIYAITNGTYTTGVALSPGTYTVTYLTPFPSGYYITAPLTGVPPTFTVTIGQKCSINGVAGASCDSSGNVTGLSFGINNTKAWFQSVCGDIRQSKGIIDPIPATPSCGGYSGAYMNQKDTNICPSNAGIAFTGSSNANFGQGQAAASPNNWIVGGNANPEVLNQINQQTVHTSYTTMLAKARQSGITPIDLATVCTLTNCTLPNNLAHGVYQANGSVNLQAFTVPANQNYIFLINGDLTLLGNISIPVGSTALFSSSGDIHVDSSVGAASTATTSNLDGFYSADKSFIIYSTNSCSTEQRLNIAGTVIVDAGLKGGSFQNNRDLCTGNASCPTISFTQRVDLILNTPAFIKTTRHIWQELLPGTTVPTPTPSPTSTPTPTLLPMTTLTPTPIPLALSNLSVTDTANAGSWSLQTNIQTGNTLYGDRTYTLATLPSSLAGSVWIRTANASKSYANDPIVTFTMNKAATVYVGFDSRATLASWVDGTWTNSGLQATDSEPVTFKFYQKTFPTGTVSLGHNATQTSGVNMYMVIVK